MVFYTGACNRRSMAVRILLVASLLSLALAGYERQPVIIWSSQRTNIFDPVLTTANSPMAFLETFLGQGDICSHDAIVFVQQAGLHASDLRTLSPFSELSKGVNSAPYSRQFTALRLPGPSGVIDWTERISGRCGHESLNLIPGQSMTGLVRDKKYVVSISMPPLYDNVENRKSVVAHHGSVLAAELEKVAAAFPNTLFILAGSSPFSGRRQEPLASISALGSDIFGAALAPNASDPAFQNTGVLKRYQILTPALITGLVIAFFVIVPMILLGVSALSSIQSTIRTEGNKAFDAQEKKDQ